MTKTKHLPVLTMRDEYGTELDKLDMAERISHKIAENNRPAFTWHPKVSSPGFITKRTIQSRMTLADVLYTFMRMGCYFTFNHNFRLTVRRKNGSNYGSTEWDCKDDYLDHQSEETVRFLFNIIVVESEQERLTGLSDAYRNPYFPPDE